MSSILISEIFGPTIQGEGALIGRPTVFVRTGGCDFRCRWCIAPETPILMADLTSKPASLIKRGDKILGMKRRDRVPEVVGAYTEGEVLGVTRRIAPRYAVEMEDGRELVVAADHAFVAHRTGRFVGAAQLSASTALRGLARWNDWKETRDYRAGYLAGAADGDGSFHAKKQGRVFHFVIATGDDEILKRFATYACSFGYALNAGRHLSGGQFAPACHMNCLRLTVTQRAREFQEFLSQYPPTLEFWQGYFAGIYDTDGSTDGKSLRISQFKAPIKVRIAACLEALNLNWVTENEGFRLRGGRHRARQILLETRPALDRKVRPYFRSLSGGMGQLRVRHSSPLPEGEVISIRTSLGTYIADGLLSRNCDSLYAVLPEYKSIWRKMGATAILAEVENFSGGAPILVTVSGGNPALQPLGELLELGRARGHAFALETQGTAAPAWLAQLDHLVLSPKPPSSDMEFSPEKLARCIQVAGKSRISLKVVVFDEADFQFARHVCALHPEIPFYLSVGNDSAQSDEADNAVLTRKLEWILERCAQEKWFDVTLLPQLHVLLWGNKRGV